MQYVILLINALGMCLLTVSSAWAEASEYHQCEIEYHIKHKAIPGKHIDTGPFRKALTVCVRNLQDCSRRAKSLVRHHEGAYVPEGEGAVPDLGSLRISGHDLTGSCSRLD